MTLTSDDVDIPFGIPVPCVRAGQQLRRYAVTIVTPSASLANDGSSNSPPDPVFL